MEKLTLTAEKRNIIGRKVKKLREGGVLPANIYSKGSPSLSIQINAIAFTKIFEKAGETGLIEISLDGLPHYVLVSSISFHPVHGGLLHVDFHEVNLKENVKASIPVELLGEAPAEKAGLGTAVLQLSEVEVEALPTDLPEKFEVDAERLVDLDSKILVSDLKHDDKIKILTELDSIVAAVAPLQAEEEVIAAPVETQITEQKSEAGGEQKAEATAADSEEKS